MPVLLTTTMPNMRLTIEALAHTDLREQARVITGSASVTVTDARQIGADDYAPDADKGVTRVRDPLQSLTQ